MQATFDTYIPDEIYNAMLSKLAAMATESRDYTGWCARSAVVEVLGEVGGIWPQSILKTDRAA